MFDGKGLEKDQIFKVDLEKEGLYGFQMYDGSVFYTVTFQ